MTQTHFSSCILTPYIRKWKLSSIIVIKSFLTKITCQQCNCSSKSSKFEKFREQPVSLSAACDPIKGNSQTWALTKCLFPSAAEFLDLKSFQRHHGHHEKDQKISKDIAVVCNLCLFPREVGRNRVCWLFTFNLLQEGGKIVRKLLCSRCQPLLFLKCFSCE